MIEYARLGTTRQLNQIVMTGSHDAGITEGGANVKTQSLDILGQATAGVRLFDIRIAGVKQSDPGIGKTAELKAYHSAVTYGKSRETRQLTNLGKQTTVDTVKLFGGDWGQGLNKMLTDARRFVEGNPGEFLILKFDKCSNWPAIADTCLRLLGNRMYAGSGSLNTKTLADLAGTVIVLFGPSGITALGQAAATRMNIHGFLNVSQGGTHQTGFDGLQYVGKGGTAVHKPFFKIGQNIDKQAKLMKKGGSGDPELMGMMYWTTTGIFESIKERDKTMWTDHKRSALTRLWANGLADSIESRLAKNIDPTKDSAGGMLKAFVPNFVMVDFADAAKCKVVYELNSVAATSLSAAWRNATAG